MTKGVRVIAVMNRKGGCGKSSLVRGLASAAAARGEKVTIFDTDKSKSCFNWMRAGKAAGNWNDLVDVKYTLDPKEVSLGIDKIYETDNGDHLVLIDTYGGAEAAHDDIVLQAHLVVAPIMPGRGDFHETMQSLMWHQRLKQRVSNPEEVPDYRVVLNGISSPPSKAEKVAIAQVFGQMPAIVEPIMQRKAYRQVDAEGLLGEIIANEKNRIVREPLVQALEEMTAVLDHLDAAVEGEGE